MLVVDGVEIININVPDLSQDEIRRYIDEIDEQKRKYLRTLTIVRCKDGKIQLDYETAPPKFERIRRITGYLVGTIDRWNNAKRAEERERIKHGVR